MEQKGVKVKGADMKKLLLATAVLVIVFLAGCRPGFERKPMIIELGFMTCDHCMQMKQVLAEVEKEYKGKVRVMFYDLDSPAGQKQEAIYGVQNVPTTVFLDKDGYEYFKANDALLKEQVIAILKSARIN